MNKAAFLPAVLLLFTLAVACGGGEELQPVPTDFPAPTGTAAASTPASCGPEGSAITAIKREGNRTFKTAPPPVIDPAKKYTAVMETSRGKITIQLAPEAAPNTVNNFVYLSCEGFYDGLTFHRVEKSPTLSVIQGGDPRGNGTGGPGYIFDNEISPLIRHDAAGVLSMANAGPNTNGSQFFITLAAAPNLDNSYSAFGRVTSGMEAVNLIVVGDKILSVSITES
ncbi:MAG TPA: peptidylprolyl isomerase [Dehalococcoidia bacterium]|nr:peptidylprolyl isomerase [Dehalococcoidia bacterium]